MSSYYSAEDYDAMGVYDAGRHDIENTIEKIEMAHPTMTCDKDSVYYLTYQSGSSNKFHCFILAQDKSGNWFAFNGAKRIGYSPQVHRIAGPTSMEQARSALVKKMRTKERKGYSIMFSPSSATQWYKSAETYGAEMDYMELPVIPDSYGTDSATEMGGRGVPVWYGSAEGMEMTPDIMDYPGLPVVPDSYGTNSALESGQGVPVWYGSAESFSAPLGGMIPDANPDVQWVIDPHDPQGGWLAVPLDPQPTPPPTPTPPTGGESGNGESTPEPAPEPAPEPQPEEENGGNEGQQEEEQQQPHDQRPPNQDGGNPDSVSAAETEMGLPVIPDSYGTDSATEMGGRGVPVWYGSAEDANPSGGATGDQIVSWEHNGLSSPSGPPSDIFWSEGDDGKLYCDRCDNLADFNFQDIDVRWDIEDGEFTGNHEMRNHLGSYNDFLCRACAEDEGFAAEMGRGSKWSEADAAHALLRRKSKKQRTIDRKKARRQKYSAEEERIRNAGELVDYVDSIMNGKVFVVKPFTLPPYLDELIHQDKAEIMTSQDEMDILFRDGSMASCIYDARNNTLNTFVVAYAGDEEYNSETLDSYNWDKTEYEKKDLEIVKPFGTAMKATMGVAAGTAAILAIMVGLTRIGGNNE